MLARILQDRLKAIAEDVLPDSQCGFRKGRGCVDMVYVARQLMEKTLEHDSDAYVLFVDLRKAYDSISRAVLWQVLQKLGVPPAMLRIIQSLHNGMTASVRVDGKLTDPITVRCGLRQGCTLAPMLFNLYFSAVVASWRSSCPDAGISFRYKVGRKLQSIHKKMGPGFGELPYLAIFLDFIVLLNRNRTTDDILLSRHYNENR